MKKIKMILVGLRSLFLVLYLIFLFPFFVDAVKVSRFTFYTFYYYYSGVAIYRRQRQMKINSNTNSMNAEFIIVRCVGWPTTLNCEMHFTLCRCDSFPVSKHEIEGRTAKLRLEHWTTKQAGKSALCNCKMGK